MTDTERLDWLEDVGGQVTIPADEALTSTGYHVHTQLGGWARGDSLREAIDKAREQAEA